MLGARAPLTNPNWRGPWDCAELASWCAFQAYGVVFGCYGSSPRKADAYSGKWYEDARDEGTLITSREAMDMPGAIIGRRPKRSGGRLIRMGHIAISLGGGRTVEARGKRYGVVTTEHASARRWDFGALIPGAAYDGGVVVPGGGDRILRVASPFMRGEDVRAVQDRLLAIGINPGTIDGIYGEDTETAVLAFQTQEGITVDGEVGADTAEALELGWPIGSGGGTDGTGTGTGSSPRTYRVQPGDTLSKIANRLEVDLDALVEANPQIGNIDLIHVGDLLTIPGESSSYRPGTGGPALDPRTLEVLAKTIYGEARSEPLEGQHAIGYVVLNRVATQSWYGHDVISVCLKNWQFSVWNRGTPSRRMLDGMSAADPRMQPQMQAARDVLTGTATNAIGGATHYYADYIRAPSWTEGATRVTKIGHHIFFKDVD